MHLGGLYYVTTQSKGKTGNRARQQQNRKKFYMPPVVCMVHMDLGRKTRIFFNLEKMEKGAGSRGDGKPYVHTKYGRYGDR